MNDTYNNQFKQIIDYLGISQKELATQLSVSQVFISTMVTGKNEITHSIIKKLLSIEKLSNSYKTLNINWLLTGAGKMFIEHELEQGGVVGVPNVTIVPFIVNAGAGIASQMVEVVTRASIPFVRSGAYAFHLKGNSMQPVFENDDWLLAYEIKNNEDVKTGKVYIIKTTDGTLLCKYIDKRGAKWILRSENYHNHANIEVPIEEISTVYDIEKRITGVFGWE